jgi:hypothetical protein
MNEFDNEEIVHALEQLIDEFEDEMTPYAIQLSQKLVRKKFHVFVSSFLLTIQKKNIEQTETFFRLFQKSEVAEEDEGEGSIAAMECLTTLQTLLYSIKDKPALLEQVELVLLPLIRKLLDPEALGSHFLHFPHFPHFPFLCRIFGGRTSTFEFFDILPRTYSSRSVGVLPHDAQGVP